MLPIEGGLSVLNGGYTGKKKKISEKSEIVLLPR